MRWFRALYALTAVATTLAGLNIYSKRALHHAEARFSPRGQFVTVEGIRLHYARQGTGQPVVLLHASGLILQDFMFSIFDQMATSYQAIALDRLGYGYSERASDRPLTLALNVRLLRGTLSQLGVEQPILVGHSGGGAVALRYALAYPQAVAGLVLIAPSAYAEGLPLPRLFYLTDPPLLGQLFLHTLLTPLAQGIAPAFVGGLFTPDSPPAGYVDTLKAFYMRPAHFRTHADELKHLPAGLREQSPSYGEIQIPVTILTGTDDEAAPPDTQAYPLHQAIPHSRLLTFPATGHALHHKYPSAVMEAIEQV